jgi:hypothetical protein
MFRWSGFLASTALLWRLCEPIKHFTATTVNIKDKLNLAEKQAFNLC